ncbi:IDI-2 precursor [Ophiocordyceps camponoti-floridani]|uniref:IDI-2 n=1 Tax=Ophiocordyceps camponoti-floridani TaxID=2030778 RepID=A0A8H4QDT0_9HYPO|nr:IDI-2 precursor [Ophiocordyceps camponoti-floridani]
MKFSSSIFLVALQAAGVLSTPASAADECGALGVLKVDLSKLPAGVDPKAIRKVAQLLLFPLDPRFIT